MQMLQKRKSSAVKVTAGVHELYKDALYEEKLYDKNKKALRFYAVGTDNFFVMPRVNAGNKNAVGSKSNITRRNDDFTRFFNYLNSGKKVLTHGEIVQILKESI